MFQPRPAQEQVLAYRGGYLAVSAVPGSGKTVTLAALAARLLETGIPEGSAVLVVTYMNSAVDHLARRIGVRLQEVGVRGGRYKVRTLHSLAREIVLEQPGLAGVAPGFAVLDERTSQSLLERALEHWLQAHPGFWERWLLEDTAQARAYWWERLLEVARAAISLAKNRRWKPRELLERLESWPDPVPELVHLALEVYALYQSYVETSGGLDFDDLVWRAVDLLEQHPDLLERLRERWPFILEDEAQDSVPLQEELLSLLAGRPGNWVRVGDPNQAITSTFTAAHPRYFRAFMSRPEVHTITMAQTGRCARRIMALANHLVEWACRRHPLPEIRERAFRLQRMEPSPPEDPQPNPPDEPGNVVIHARGYGHREREELPAMVRLVARYRARFPSRTLAILVPTNELGYRVSALLKEQGLPHDELLESSSQARGVAGLLAGLLQLAAQPIDRSALARAFERLVDHGWLPLAQERAALSRLLSSCVAPERLLFPEPGEDPLTALPAGRAGPAEMAMLAPFLDLARRIIQAASLPVDQLVLLIAASVLTQPGDLATAQQIATHLRHLQEADPALRLPELARELERIAAGRRRFVGLSDEDLAFEPQPGRITVATQHRAKGLEWDLVCLVGIDRYWVPHELSDPFQGTHPEAGGNPTAIVQAWMRALMGEQGALADAAEATKEACLETIAERLRLLYVGITRARRHLHISWSRQVERYGRDRPQEGTPVLAELDRFLRRLAQADKPRPGP
jgi:DNA helicase-2/ATP-dependent DNA helicase PcrA